jgi:hypothetical protein
MFVRKLTPWPGCYFAPETGAESGADAGTGAGAADHGTSAGTGTEPGKAEEEKAEESAEQRFLRLADRYRNEAGQAAKKARELEARLREVEDAQKPELQRLAERAEQVPVLERERDDWKARAEAAEAALTAEVEARQKALPKEMLDLLPENATPPVNSNGSARRPPPPRSCVRGNSRLREDATQRCSQAARRRPKSSKTRARETTLPASRPAGRTARRQRVRVWQTLHSRRPIASRWWGSRFSS